MMGMQTMRKSTKRIEVGLACLALLWMGCQDPSPQPVTATASPVLEEDSTEHFDALIVASPNDPALYVDRAAWHLRRGRISEGLLDLNLAIEADSTYAPAWSAKAARDFLDLAGMTPT